MTSVKIIRIATVICLILLYLLTLWCAHQWGYDDAVSDMHKLGPSAPGGEIGLSLLK